VSLALRLAHIHIPTIVQTSFVWSAVQGVLVLCHDDVSSELVRTNESPGDSESALIVKYQQARDTKKIQSWVESGRPENKIAEKPTINQGASQQQDLVSVIVSNAGCDSTVDTDGESERLHDCRACDGAVDAGKRRGFRTHRFLGITL
jgi:hypothetical protein